MLDRLTLHAYRYLDPATGRWARARRRDTILGIRQRHAHYELIVEPALRRGEASLYRLVDTAGMADAEPDMEPVLDVVETTLAACFLRRYVRWCARRGRFGAMEGAARLLRALPRSA